MKKQRVFFPGSIYRNIIELFSFLGMRELLKSIDNVQEVLSGELFVDEDVK